METVPEVVDSEYQSHRAEPHQNHRDRRSGRYRTRPNALLPTIAPKYDRPQMRTHAR